MNGGRWRGRNSGQEEAGDEEDPSGKKIGMRLTRKNIRCVEKDEDC